MNEQTLTYEHFDKCSFLIAAIGLAYIPMILISVINFPMLIAYISILFVFLIFSMGRYVSFIRRQKSLTQKALAQIIKRHRFSLKWFFVNIPLSVFISLICLRIFGMNYIQTIGVFGLIHMLTLFLGIRVFLRNLKRGMNAMY